MVIQLHNEYFITVYYEWNKLFYFQDIYDPYDVSNNTFIRIIDNVKLYYLNGKYHIINQQR